MGALVLHFPVMAAVAVALGLPEPITLTHLLLAALAWRHQSQEPQSLAPVVAVVVA